MSTVYALTFIGLMSTLCWLTLHSVNTEVSQRCIPAILTSTESHSH